MDHPLQLKYQRNYSIIIMTVMFLFFIILITESAINKLTWSFSTHTVFMKS